MFWSIGFEEILIIGLAAFRLTRLFVFDKITEFIRAPFFDEVLEGDEIYLQPKQQGFQKWVGELLACYWCTGMWVSLMLLLGYILIPKLFSLLIVFLAIAAVGAIIETFISFFIGE